MSVRCGLDINMRRKCSADLPNLFQLRALCVLWVISVCAHLWLPVYVLHLIFFLEQFYVQSKIERKVRGLPYSPRPPTRTASPIATSRSRGDVGDDWSAGTQSPQLT